MLVQVVLDQDQLVEVFLEPSVYLCFFYQLIFQISNVVLLIYYFLALDGQLGFKALVVLGVIRSCRFTQLDFLRDLLQFRLQAENLALRSLDLFLKKSVL